MHGNPRNYRKSFSCKCNSLCMVTPLLNDHHHKVVYALSKLCITILKEIYIKCALNHYEFTKSLKFHHSHVIILTDLRVFSDKRMSTGAIKTSTTLAQ